jgi:hypothetical protein
MPGNPYGLAEDPMQIPSALDESPGRRSPTGSGGGRGTDSFVLNDGQGT